MSRRGSLADLEDFSPTNGKWRDPYIKGLLYEGQIACCFGQQEVGKSYLWGQLGVSIAAGEDWGKGRLQIPESREVLYLLSEGTEWDLSERLVPLYQQYPNALDHFEYYLPDYIDFLDQRDAGLKELTTMIHDLNIEVLIMDSLYSCQSGSVDNARDMGRFKMALNKLHASQPRLATVMLHHEHRPKRDFEGGIVDERENSIAGSWVISAMCDEMYHFTRPANDRNGPRRFVPTKHRSRLHKVDPFVVELDEATGLLTTEAVALSNRAQELRQRMKSIGGMTTADLTKWAKDVKVGSSTARRYARQLVDMGDVTKVSGGWEWKS